MTERSFTAYLKTTQRPELIRIDPDVTLLAEIKEEKARDWWIAQLAAPTVMERIRAIEHLVSGKTDANREAIAGVLQNDSFWGVRVEAAKALGRLAGKPGRQALLAGLDQTHAKVRKACVDGLKSFKQDQEIIDALQKRNLKGDESYTVEAAILSTLVSILKETPVELLKASLKKDSHRESIRLAALRGLGTSDDPKILQLLVAWTQRGKPRICRQEAVRQVVSVINRTKPQSEITDPIVERFLEMLDENEGARTRTVLVESLGRLGTRARTAGPRLRILADADPNGRVRTAAAKAAEDSQKEPNPNAEIARLRREVNTANRKNTELEKRLQKLESQ